MSAEPASEHHRQTFEDLRHRAIVCGQRPSDTTTLGPATAYAIDMVARAHPEATAEQIMDAYDAFRLERG
jgi:hypothetical protein